MATRRDELDERLHALVGGDVPDDVRARHQAAIRAAAAAAGPATVGAAPDLRWSWARRAATGVIAATAVAIPGVAVASQRAVPGDRLFGVKVVAERVEGLVASNVRAVHRVEELEELVRRGAEPEDVSEALTRAQDAMASVPEDDPLWARFRTAQTDALALMALAAPSAPRSDDSGPGSSNSGPGSVNSGRGSVNSGPGSVDSGRDDDDDTDDDGGSVNSGSGSVNSGPGSVNSGRDADDDDTDDEVDEDRSGPGAGSATATPTPTPSVDDDETDDEDRSGPGSGSDDRESDSSGSGRSGSGSDDAEDD